MKPFWKTVLNPGWYHGVGAKRPFFEGWYFKLIDATTQHKYAIIPGVFLSDDPHAFIQVLNGTTKEAFYHRYPLEQFWAAEDRFEVHIGASRFTPQALSLLIDRPDQKMEADLQFGGGQPWPVSVGSPGIMGWYAWVPTMECYHGVLSFDHTIYGTMRVNGRRLDFSGGRGYIEKDWGQSFPSAWIWLQTNHFEHSPRTSLTASIAMIPWQFTRFRGFIVGLWHGGRLYRFATYTGAKTETLSVAGEQIHWVLTGKTAGAVHRLEIIASRGEAGILAGPSTVDMGVRVAESLTATATVRLSRLVGGRDEPIFVGNGRFAGLEVHNVEEELLAAK
ncbi:MAG: tocopherol cyclase family protein [Chloroflexota bacterium]